MWGILSNIFDIKIWMFVKEILEPNWLPFAAQKKAPRNLDS